MSMALNAAPIPKVVPARGAASQSQGKNPSEGEIWDCLDAPSCWVLLCKPSLLAGFPGRRLLSLMAVSAGSSHSLRTCLVISSWSFLTHLTEQESK